LMFGEPKAAVNAFSSPVRCPSLHFIGKLLLRCACS
jgi:hypothetical protein